MGWCMVAGLAGAVVVCGIVMVRTCASVRPSPPPRYNSPGTLAAAFSSRYVGVVGR